MNHDNYIYDPLRQWLANKDDIAIESIANIEVSSSKGYPSYSEVTPGEAWSFQICYKLRGEPLLSYLEISKYDAGKFLEELASYV